MAPSTSWTGLVLVAVNVPPQLISFCLVAVVVLGLVFVLVGLIGRPRLDGPPIKLGIGKFQMANLRPRTLVLLLGTVLVMAPLAIALFQRDAVASVTTQIAPALVTDVENLPEDELRGVSYLSDTSVLDLRGAGMLPWYRRLLFWEPRQTGPVRLTNIMRLRLDAPVSQVTMTYGTSGTMSARCLTHRFSVRRHRGHADPGTEGSAESWQIVVPLDGVAIGQDFELVNEITYWNAFWREHESYTTYENAQQAIEQLSTVVLFPDDRPFKTIHRRVGVHGQSESQPIPEASPAFAPSDRLTYGWQIVGAGGRDAKPLAYTVQWNW